MHSFKQWLDRPAVNIAIFAFLLNFVWEMWQIWFFEGMLTVEHWKGVAVCTLATFGDVLIALAAFWIVARFTRKDWIMHPGWKEMSGFIATGVVIIIIAEKFGTDILGLWHYNELMPTLPFVGTGLLPILEWTVLPPLIVWFARRQTHV